MSTYEIIKLLGKGGMGEVWLAKDPICDRQIALKKLRQDLRFSPAAHERFMREAKIAAQLSHPSIIPVYTIHDEGKQSFYTMPYVEGQTLKEVLNKTRKDPTFSEGSISNLLRILVHVCQAVSHAHAKHILHRDLKPENVILGKRGEVMILDWGLAGYIGAIDPKKIDGTLTHMAPERAFGAIPSPLNDVYALGVILYQILTLRLPFRRTTLEQFRKTKDTEQLQDPCEIAPYRDIPLSLAYAVKACLSSDPEKRIQSASELTTLLLNYMEGRPEWIPTASLSLDKPKDWEFQEHILLAKHIALSGKSDLMEWTYMMVSKLSFSGNSKIHTNIRLSPSGSGIGFLLDIPSAPFRKSPEEGYCIWLTQTRCSLFRTNVEILTKTHNYPLTEQLCTVCIEKIGNTLRFYIENTPIFDYTSYLPSRGEHIGLLYKDSEFAIENLSVFLGSQNVQVSCLAVPDAFLAHRQFGKALIEYKRIARCFPGRTEGREALFRSGLALLEAHSSSRLCTEALDTFSCLRKTPGAPLEYLGKALVYQAAHDTEEEIKCLELALRKYAKHPELSTVIEHTIFRLHEASCKDRTAGYRFALLALTHLPYIFETPDHKQLLETLETHIHPTYFATHLDVRIAFWLAKPLTLLEIAEKTIDTEKAIQALFALLELGFGSWVKAHLHHKELHSLFAFQNKNIPFTDLSVRAQHYIMKKDPSYATLCTKDSQELDALRIRTLLEQKKWKEAQALLDKYPIEEKTAEHSPLYPLFGCLLFATETQEIALHHFTPEIERNFPPLPALLGYYIKGKICLKKGWISQAFFEEKRSLLEQLKLFFLCTEDPKMYSVITKKVKTLERTLLSSYTLPDAKLNQ